MLNIEKEREAFEQFVNDTYKDLIDKRICINSDGDYMAWDMQVAWRTWQAATARAEENLEASVILTGHDIKYISEFMVYSDPENIDHEVTIQDCLTGFDGKGLYAWVTEYPEEGGIKLGIETAMGVNHD